MKDQSVKVYWTTWGYVRTAQMKPKQVPFIALFDHDSIVDTLTSQLKKAEAWNEELQRLCAEKDAEIAKLKFINQCHEDNARDVEVNTIMNLQQEVAELKSQLKENGHIKFTLTEVVKICSALGIKNIAIADLTPTPDTDKAAE